MPSTDPLKRPRRTIFSGERRELVSNVIEHIRVGQVARAPWQRPIGWTESQQIHMLDSMMRGISIGAVTMWEPPPNLRGLGRPFFDCGAEPGAALVVDGQQRLTTLVKAAAGGLDHWRWDGQAWNCEAPGFLTPSMAVRGHGADGLDWFTWLQDSGARDAIRRCVNEREVIARTDLHMLVLTGSAEHMVETYRRLATAGSPHSVEDLAIMERWLAEQAVE